MSSLILRCHLAPDDWSCRRATGAQIRSRAKKRASPQLIRRCDCNDKSSPVSRFRRLVCNPKDAAALFRPCWRESSRTISARCGGVNRKMDKLTRRPIGWLA
jgi:hypothetical protein